MVIPGSICGFHIEFWLRKLGTWSILHVHVRLWKVNGELSFFQNPGSANLIFFFSLSNVQFERKSTARKQSPRTSLNVNDCRNYCYILLYYSEIQNTAIFHAPPIIWKLLRWHLWKQVIRDVVLSALLWVFHDILDNAFLGFWKRMSLFFAQRIPFKFNKFFDHVSTSDESP